MQAASISLADLPAVPSTLLIPLAARARGAELFPKLKFEDPSAQTILDRLEQKGEAYLRDRLTVFGSLKRCQIIRRTADAFFSKHPEAIGVNLGCGLSNYFQWLDNGKNSYVDFDLPEVMEIRSQLLSPTGKRHRFVGGSLADSGWWEALKLPPHQPVIAQCEGVSMYLKPQQVSDLLSTFAQNAPHGSELVLDHMCWLGVGQAHRSPAVRKTRAQFHWGLRNNEEFSKIHPRLTLIEQHTVLREFNAWIRLVENVFKKFSGVPIYGLSHLGLKT